MAQEQNLTTGVLALTLQPGRIGEIRFEEPVSWRGRLWNAIPASRGNILNLRDIEQGLENFRRVPSANADIKIVPGAEDGTSDLQVNWHEGRPVRLSLGMDDSGSKSTGRYLGSATLAIDAPFAQNDLFYANIGKDMFQHGPLGNRSHTLNYFFPVGYWAFSANYNDYTYHQNIPNANEVLRYSGKSDNIQLTVSRLLYRDQSHKTTLNLRGYRRHSTNAVDDVDIVSQNVGPPVGSWGLTSAAISVPPRWMRISAGAAVLEHLMPCLHRKNRVMKAAPVPACCSATWLSTGLSPGASSPGGCIPACGASGARMR